MVDRRRKCIVCSVGAGRRDREQMGIGHLFGAMEMSRSCIVVFLGHLYKGSNTRVNRGVGTWYLDTEVTWAKLEDVTVGDITQTQTDKYCLTPCVCEAPRGVPCIGTESRW